MRKLLFLCLILAISSISVSAVSPSQLAALAAYYPEGTLFFAALRTDDDYLTQLDTLLAQTSASLMPAAEAPSLSQLLDTFAEDLANTSFAAGVRPWLGDTLAIGVTFDVDDFADMAAFPGFITASVTDKDTALKTINAVLKENNFTGSYEISERGDFTVYTADFSGDPSFAVGDAVLFFGTDVSAFPLNPVKAPLAKAPDFNDTLQQLPADSYNGLMYINLPALMAFNAEISAEFGQTTPSALAAFNETTGSQLWGFTFLDATTLAIDFVVKSDLDTLQSLGLSTYIPAPVNLAFAERIPADAAFVVHSSDFGAVTQASLDNIRGLSNYIAQNGGFSSLLALPEGMLRPEEAAALDLITPGSLLAILNVSFAGLTGLSLERDVLPVLDGDSALYLRLLPAPRRFPLPTPFIPDMALLFQSSDAAGAQMLLDALMIASDAYDTGYKVEAYGDNGAALVAPLLSQALRADATMLDFMVAADGDIFALGTRPAVESAVSADANLTDTPEFQAASAHFLPNSQSIGYVSLTPIGNLIADGIRNNTFPRSSLRDLGDILRFAGLLQSATLSASVEDDGWGVARLTLTLWAERAPFIPEN